MDIGVGWEGINDFLWNNWTSLKVFPLCSRPCDGYVADCMWYCILFSRISPVPYWQVSLTKREVFLNPTWLVKSTNISWPGFIIAEDSIAQAETNINKKLHLKESLCVPQSPCRLLSFTIPSVVHDVSWKNMFFGKSWDLNLRFSWTLFNVLPSFHSLAK